MSDQASWQSFGKTVGWLAGAIAVLLLLAFGAMSYLFHGFSGFRATNWSTPPFGIAHVESLESGTPVCLFDDDSSFMVIAPGDMRAEAIQPHDIFRGTNIDELIKIGSSQRGPWIAGTLDGRPTFVLELPSHFRVTTTGFHGGYSISPSRNSDGTVSITLSRPNN